MMETSAVNTGNPLSDQQRPEQPMGGNPLARIAPQMGGQQQQPPVPTRAQTTAAVHHFSAIQQALKPILKNPKLGKENIRPDVLDAGSKLIGSKILSLPELMNQISEFPSDPLDQKARVQKIYTDAQNAEASVLDHYGAALAAGKLPSDGGPEYQSSDHASHMDSLLGAYKR